MGSIDKFGRRKGSHCIGQRGPQGIGFKLTTEKQYDIQGKQLKNIADPTDENDSTTLNYVNLVVDVCKKEILSAVQQSANLITDNLIAYIKRERNEIMDEVTKMIQNSQTKMDNKINTMKVEVGELKTSSERNWSVYDKLVQNMLEFTLDIENIEQLIAKYHPPRDKGRLVFPGMASQPIDA